MFYERIFVHKSVMCLRNVGIAYSMRLLMCRMCFLYENTSRMQFHHHPTPSTVKMGTENVDDIPVVVVLGETGVGKTKLAVELCCRYGGEVISADSMQVYKGLNIATNKASRDEMQGVSQHMIDIVSPAFSEFNVRMFREMALKAIRECWYSRHSIPVIVGGTNYYIEALLWNQLAGVDDSEQHTKVPFDTDTMASDKLHRELEKVDPDTALKLHPEDRRRVIRCLEICYGTGQMYSRLISKQSPVPRFRHICILWLRYTSMTLLEMCLRDRVDDMVERGLRKEIEEFHDRWHEEHVRVHGQSAMTRGVFQAIGLKEFRVYLALAPDTRVSNEAGVHAFSDGVEKLKRRSVQYAHKQQRWIANRICNAAARDSICVHRISVGRGQWHTDVLEPAARIVHAFLAEHKKMHTTVQK